MIDDLYDDGGMDSILEFDVDLSTVEKPEELPPGNYRGEVTKAEAKTSNNTGSRYMALSVLIPTSEFPPTYETENAPEGLPLIYRRISLEPGRRPMYRLRTFCESMGVVPAKQIDLNDFVGRPVMVEIVHESYEGEERATIKNLRGA